MMQPNAFEHAFRGLLHGTLDPVTMSLLLALPIGRRLKASADRARKRDPKYRAAQEKKAAEEAAKKK